MEGDDFLYQEEALASSKNRPTVLIIEEEPDVCPSKDLVHSPVNHAGLPGRNCETLQWVTPCYEGQRTHL